MKTFTAKQFDYLNRFIEFSIEQSEKEILKPAKSIESISEKFKDLFGEDIPKDIQEASANIAEGLTRKYREQMTKELETFKAIKEVLSSQQAEAEMDNMIKDVTKPSSEESSSL